MTTAGASLRTRSRYLAYLVPIGAVTAALLIGAVMLLLLDASPIEGVRAMFRGAFGSWNALTSTALKATPLLFVGVGITIAFRANVINIGGEGQMVAGGLLSTVVALALPDWPAWVMLPAVLLAGIAGGAIWGAVPGALKAYYGVNEILSTIMLNVVAVQLMNFLLRGALIDPGEIERGTRIPQTARLQEGADLPLLFGSGRFHIGPLLVGGNALQRAVQVPSALILALNGLVVVFVVATDRLRKRLRNQGSRVDATPAAAPAPPAGSPPPGSGEP